jgi:tricorn protease
MKPGTLLALLLPVLLARNSAAREPQLLLQNPTLSRNRIAFSYGGDIWVVNREGGDAQRVVTGTGMAAQPIFSPDGEWIAYTGNYDGNEDVYVVPSLGGQPKRLTYHPGPDVAVGWTPDGKSILFRSHRSSPTDPNRLFTVALTGSFPEQLPLSMAEEGSFSPDRAHIAIVPNFQWEPAWKQYRGGQTTPIWIVDLSDSSIERVPHDNSNDRNPIWIGDCVYFLSDRNGPVTLFKFDLETKKVSQVVKNDGFDIASASAGPGAIVYAQFDSLHLYDLASGTSKLVRVTLRGDMPQLRPHFEKVEKQIENARISPTGARAVFEAHGEILTVPAEKGDIRNLSQTPGIQERDPAWSPDGASIAYFSDESGEYALHIRGQNGMGSVKKIDLGRPPSFFYSPTWSPDSKKIAFSDKRLNLWYVDVAHPTPVRVAADRFDSPLHEFGVVWSPDSRWLAYTLQLENHLRAVFVYSLETHKATQVTDGMSDALHPQFDRSGKYLIFTASTDMGLTTGWLDMTSEAHPVTRSVYVAVLKKDLPSPLAPESDDEKTPATKEKDKADKSTADQDSADASDDSKTDADKPAKKEKERTKEPPKVEIDFDNLGQRVLALPIPARNYTGLNAGKEGILFLAEGPQIFTDSADNDGLTIRKFDLKTRKTEKLLDGVTQLDVSFDGEKVLYEKGRKWFIAKTDKAPEPGKGLLKTADLEVKVDPPAEWRQIYNEVWRIERDFFYAPSYHGLDLDQAKARFAPYLEGIASREDLNYLFREMLSYMSVGHMFVGGGAQPELKTIKVGLLGADYEMDHGRYRFQRIYNGENWNPKLHAPLTQPGVNVQEGEYLLAVNGHDLFATNNALYSLFQETANRQTVLKVGRNPDGTGSRDVTVVPIESEDGLRRLNWIESNRRKVDEMTDGRVAYVYLPNTAGAGFENFNRYYFAQIGKEAVIIDERFNHGG